MQHQGRVLRWMNDLHQTAAAWLAMEMWECRSKYIQDGWRHRVGETESGRWPERWKQTHVSMQRRQIWRLHIGALNLKLMLHLHTSQCIKAHCDRQIINYWNSFIIVMSRYLRFQEMLMLSLVPDGRLLSQRWLCNIRTFKHLIVLPFLQHNS